MWKINHPLHSPASPSAFISYSRENNDEVKQLQAVLHESGTSVWRDEKDLYGGQRWPKALGEAVVSSDTLVLLWSGAAAKSEFVELEWCTALALRKPIVPVLLDDTPLAAVHAPSWVQAHAILATDSENLTVLARRLQADAERMANPSYRLVELLRICIAWVSALWWYPPRLVAGPWVTVDTPDGAAATFAMASALVDTCGEVEFGSEFTALLAPCCAQRRELAVKYYR